MKKLMIVLALALLLVPGFVMAQTPSYCTTNGDPVLRYGFHHLNLDVVAQPAGTYNQPGPDFENMVAGQTMTYLIALGDAGDAGSIPGCGFTAAPDTFCSSATSKRGWVIVGDPPLGAMQINSGGAGYVMYDEVSITVPCSATPGVIDTFIFREHYWNTKNNACAPECPDCINPNLRSGVKYYNADTLIITVVASPPALGVLQDTLTLVDRGTTSAYVPFTICNQDECAPPTLFSYNIRNKGVTGRIPVINQSGSTTVVGGNCKDVYGIIDAGLAQACDYDTLTIIAWTPEPAVYDTCVQVIHIIEPEPVPLFTVPVVTILVLALILAAAVFMRRRAVSRA